MKRLPRVALPSVVRAALARWRVPGRDRIFVVVQLLVVLIIIGYEAAEAAGVPWPLHSEEFVPIALFVIPMVYVARGFRPIGVALILAWVTALVAVDIALDRRGHERWADGLQVAIIGTVAVCVGYRVRHEMLVRRRAEDAAEALRTSEARYRALFEQSRAPILLVTSDGLVREANVAAGALLRGASSSLVGRPLEQLIGHGVARLLLAGKPPSVLVLPTRTGDEIVVRPVSTVVGDGLRQIVLHDVTEERRERRRREAYAASVLRGQEEERRRIALELHDEPVQTLIYLCRRLDAVPHRAELPMETLISLGQMREVAERVARDLRELARGLRPPSLDDLGLVASLRHICATTEQRTGSVTTLAVRGAERRLVPEIELSLFRIAQEALRNAERHAAARRIAVRLIFAHDVRLTVRDDGIGFTVQPATSADEGTELGLLGMQERAALLGGRVTVRSSPGAGTSVRATIPGLRQPLAAIGAGVGDTHYHIPDPA